MDARTITTDQIKAIAARYGVEYAALMAVITVESSGVGFNPPTGKIIIRFEPNWFERLSEETSGAWNGPSGNQAVEWALFDAAYAVNATAAMEATSLGMMQVMGFHFREVGFGTVGSMWDFAKVNEANQVELGMRFIKSDPALIRAMQRKDWPTFAYYYNGQDYRENNYDARLLNAYNKYATV